MGRGHRVSRETAAPSAFEKEDPLPEIPGPRRASRLALRLGAALCLGAVAVAETSLPPMPRLSLNGRDLGPSHVAELASAAYRVPLQGGASARGLSLGELFPLVSEAWRLEAELAAGRRSWEADDLGERLFSLYLVEGAPGSWDLVSIGGRAGGGLSGGDLLRGVRAISVEGELLAEDGLEFWASWEGVPRLKAEVASFARTHGKSIRVTEVPNTQTKLLAVARARGTLPDLVMIQSDYVPALARAQLIQSVEYLKGEDLVAKGFDAFRDQGRFWALPLYFDAQLVFYRPALAGEVPMDWKLEDLEARARSLRGKIEAPLSWNVYSVYWLLSFMSGFGKDGLEGPDGSVVLDDEPTANALGRLLSMCEEGLLLPLERDAMLSYFAAGKAAFILSGSYSIPEFERIGIDFAVAPYPVVASTGRPVAPLLDFKGLAISRRTTKPVLARRLSQYLTAPGFQGRFTSALSKLPASTIAWEASRSENRYFAQLSRSYDIGMIVPPGETYGAFKNVMWKLLRFLFSGQMGVRETLATAERLVKENLEGMDR
jgi:arabinogalactan oligomer/maltooligosaccharide transport system substrate-binding protein